MSPAQIPNSLPSTQTPAAQTSVPVAQIPSPVQIPQPVAPTPLLNALNSPLPAPVSFQSSDFRPLCKKNPSIGDQLPPSYYLQRPPALHPTAAAIPVPSSPKSSNTLSLPRLPSIEQPPTWDTVQQTHHPLDSSSEPVTCYINPAAGALSGTQTSRSGKLFPLTPFLTVHLRSGIVASWNSYRIT